MNIVEEFIKKYEGKYYEDQKVCINSSQGKICNQRIAGLMEVDGSKISINITELSHAARTTEPYRITLYLDKLYTAEFIMYPKSIWNKLKDLLFSGKTKFIPEAVRNEFFIDGDEDVCKRLVSSKTFVENTLKEPIYIQTENKKTSQIILTPAHGINDVAHLEKLITILKEIEKVIKRC